MEIDQGGWPRWPQVDLPGALGLFEQILSGRVWTVRAPGPDRSLTEQAEAAFAEFCTSAFALMVSSGTAAVELAIRALQPAEGAKVIVPALGWFATAAAVSRAGARPVFADVDVDTSCIDPGAVERLVDDQVIAVVAVHLHCALADLEALAAICERHDLVLVEDCAQAHGARYAGRPVGTIGAMGCFSFNQEKMIAVGEGGAVITNDPGLFDRLHALRTDGYVRDGGPGRSYVPQNVVRGGNACASEFAAALLLRQLERFPEQHRQRERVAARLSETLAAVPGVRLLETAGRTSQRAYHEFAFFLDPEAFGERPAERCGAELAGILGFPIHATDEPTEECPMMALDRDGCAPSGARSIFETLLVFHHSVLLDERVVQRLPPAIEAVRHGKRRSP